MIKSSKIKHLPYNALMGITTFAIMFLVLIAYNMNAGEALFLAFIAYVYDVHQLTTNDHLEERIRELEKKI